MEFTIVLLALVAAFLGLRLYSVLGKRTGHEQEPFSRPLEKSSIPRAPETAEPVADAPAPQQVRPSLFDQDAENGIRQIASNDRNFDMVTFVEGAKSAYRMILEAFWEGDKATLKELADDDVYASFAEAIDSRNERGETLSNKLVRIDEARITQASMIGNEAQITLHFDADIAALVRDVDGNVIGGSLSDAVETHDDWTFARDIYSSDPNWRLVETEAD